MLFFDEFIRSIFTKLRDMTIKAFIVCNFNVELVDRLVIQSLSNALNADLL